MKQKTTGEKHFVTFNRLMKGKENHEREGGRRIKYKGVCRGYTIYCSLVILTKIHKIITVFHLVFYADLRFYISLQFSLLIHSIFSFLLMTKFVILYLVFFNYFSSVYNYSYYVSKLRSPLDINS